MTDNPDEALALHRWAVIAQAVNHRLSPTERGQVVRAIAAATHCHPDGTQRRYGRSTIDRWITAWKSGGIEALGPQRRVDAGAVRKMPELFDEAAALRLELPTRSSAQISDILFYRHSVRVSERTLRAQLARRGLNREALGAEPHVFGRYEADHPNERWITDVLVDPWVPFPRVESSIRARLFIIVDDHSRLLVHGRFMERENARAGQDVLRTAITKHGVPEILYADNGSPFIAGCLKRTCAMLGIRLIHSKPYSPQGRGKQERLNRYIRERFISEACHAGIGSIEELNDAFDAWVHQVANRRIHCETGQSPEARHDVGAPHRAADPNRLIQAFKWSVTRKVTATATVPLEGNSYSVDPCLVFRRVELRYDPEDLTVIDVFYEGRPAGVATAFVIGRHVARQVPQAARVQPEPTGIDYLGMVATAHETENESPISFASAPLFGIEKEGQ
jgi:putative transposase